MPFSTCEIKNDTKVDMWITHKTDWAALGSFVGLTAGVVVAVVGTALSLGAASPALIGWVGSIGTAIGLEGLGAGFFLTTAGWEVVIQSVGAVSSLGGLLGLNMQEIEDIKHELEVDEGKGVIVHTDKTMMQIFEENSKEDLAKVANKSVGQIEEIQQIIHDFKYGGPKRIAPGKSYKFSAACFSVWRAHMLSVNMEGGAQNVWVGFWWGTTNKYKVTQLWEKIDQDKVDITVHKAVKAA